MKATIIGLIAPILWSTFPAVSLTVQDIPPIQFMATSLLFSSFFSLCYLYYNKTNFINLIKQPKSILLFGSFSIFIFNVLYLISLKISSPADVFLITGTWPISAIIFSIVILKIRILPLHVVSAILGLLGVFFIALNNQDNFSDSHIYGYIGAAICSCSWALFSVLSKKFVSISHDTICIYLIGACILSFITHFIFEETAIINFKQIIFISYIGIGPIAIAYFCWQYGMKNGYIISILSISFFSHFIAIALLILFGFAEITNNLIIAFILLVSGGYIGTIAMRQKIKKKIA